MVGWLMFFDRLAGLGYVDSSYIVEVEAFNLIYKN